MRFIRRCVMAASYVLVFLGPAQAQSVPSNPGPPLGHVEGHPPGQTTTSSGSISVKGACGPSNGGPYQRADREPLQRRHGIDCQRQRPMGMDLRRQRWRDARVDLLCQ